MEKRDDVRRQGDGDGADSAPQPERPPSKDLHALKRIKKRQEYAQHLNETQKEDLTANAIILKRLWRLLKTDDRKAA